MLVECKLFTPVNLPHPFLDPIGSLKLGHVVVVVPKVATEWQAPKISCIFDTLELLFYIFV